LPRLTLGAKAQQASDKADQYRATRRQNISELHKRWPDEWLQIVKEQCKIGRSKAYKQLAIADGRTTEEIEREKTAGRTEKARRNNPLGSGNAEISEESEREKKQRGKDEQNQSPRHVTEDAEASADARKQTYAEEDREDCDTDAQVAPNAGKSVKVATAVVLDDLDNWDFSDEERALACAFAERAELARAAASYPQGALTPRVLEKASAAAVAWANLTRALHAELAAMDEQEANQQ
jgi:hypothetical protein